MGLLRRGDLADRCLYRMRAAYTVQGWERYLTTLTVIAARPAGGRPHG
jgi:hypothetical protein